jgi:hypothetical protein
VLSLSLSLSFSLFLSLSLSLSFSLDMVFRRPNGVVVQYVALLTLLACVADSNGALLPCSDVPAFLSANDTSYYISDCPRSLALYLVAPLRNVTLTILRSNLNFLQPDVPSNLGGLRDLRTLSDVLVDLRFSNVVGVGVALSRIDNSTRFSNVTLVAQNVSCTFASAVQGFPFQLSDCVDCVVDLQDITLANQQLRLLQLGNRGINSHREPTSLVNVSIVVRRVSCTVAIPSTDHQQNLIETINVGTIGTGILVSDVFVELVCSNDTPPSFSIIQIINGSHTRLNVSLSGAFLHSRFVGGVPSMNLIPHVSMLQVGNQEEFSDHQAAGSNATLHLCSLSVTHATVSGALASFAGVSLAASGELQEGHSPWRQVTAAIEDVTVENMTAIEYLRLFSVQAQCENCTLALRECRVYNLSSTDVLSGGGAVGDRTIVAVYADDRGNFNHSVLVLEDLSVKICCAGWFHAVQLESFVGGALVTRRLAIDIGNATFSTAVIFATGSLLRTSVSVRDTSFSFASRTENHFFVSDSSLDSLVLFADNITGMMATVPRISGSGDPASSNVFLVRQLVNPVSVKDSSFIFSRMNITTTTKGEVYVVDLEGPAIDCLFHVTSSSMFDVQQAGWGRFWNFYSLLRTVVALGAGSFVSMTVWNGFFFKIAAPGIFSNSTLNVASGARIQIATPFSNPQGYIIHISAEVSNQSSIAFHDCTIESLLGFSSGIVLTGIAMTDSSIRLRNMSSHTHYTSVWLAGVTVTSSVIEISDSTVSQDAGWVISLQRGSANDLTFIMKNVVLTAPSALYEGSYALNIKNSPSNSLFIVDQSVLSHAYGVVFIGDESGNPMTFSNVSVQFLQSTLQLPKILLRESSSLQAPQVLLTVHVVSATDLYIIFAARCSFVSRRDGTADPASAMSVVASSLTRGGLLFTSPQLYAPASGHFASLVDMDIDSTVTESFLNVTDLTLHRASPSLAMVLRRAVIMLGPIYSSFVAISSFRAFGSGLAPPGEEEEDTAISVPVVALRGSATISRFAVSNLTLECFGSVLEFLAQSPDVTGSTADVFCSRFDGSWLSRRYVAGSTAIPVILHSTYAGEPLSAPPRCPQDDVERTRSITATKQCARPFRPLIAGKKSASSTRTRPLRTRTPTMQSLAGGACPRLSIATAPLLVTVQDISDALRARPTVSLTWVWAKDTGRPRWAAVPLDSLISIWVEAGGAKPEAFGFAGETMQAALRSAPWRLLPPNSSVASQGLFQSISLTVPLVPTFSLSETERVVVRVAPLAFEGLCDRNVTASFTIAGNPFVTAADERVASFSIAVAATAVLITAVTGGGALLALDAHALTILSAMSCAPPAEVIARGSMKYILSPFYDYGLIWVLVGNILLTIALGMVYAAIATVFWAVRRCSDSSSWPETMRRWFVPGMCAGVALFFAPGVAFASLFLFQERHSTGAGDDSGGRVAAGVLGLVWWTFIVTGAGVCVLYRRGIFVKYNNLDSRHGAVRWLFPVGFWSQRDSRLTLYPLQFFTHGSSELWFLWPLLFSFGLSFVSAFHSSSASACISIYFVLMVFCGLSGGVVGFVNPGRSPAVTVFSCLSLFWMAVFCLVLGVNNASPTISSSNAVTYCLVVQVIMMLVGALYTAALVFLEAVPLATVRWKRDLAVDRNDESDKDDAAIMVRRGSSDRLSEVSGSTVHPTDVHIPAPAGEADGPASLRSSRPTTPMSDDRIFSRPTSARDREEKDGPGPAEVSVKSAALSRKKCD